MESTLPKNEIKKDEIKTEILVLIFKYLNEIGFDEVSKALENQLQKNDFTFMRADIDGESKINFSQLIGQFEHIPGSHLFDSILQCLKLFRNSPESLYSGVSSIISKRFPTPHDEKNKTFLSVNPLNPNMNIMTSVMKRSYGFYKPHQSPNIQESLLNLINFKKQILGHLASSYCVVFDRTGEYIITGSDDCLIKIWNIKFGLLVATLRGHSSEICDIAISQDNKYIASGSLDKTVRVWSTQTSEEICILYGHTGTISSVKFCPKRIDGKYFLISTGTDANLIIWLFEDGKFVNHLKFNEKLKHGSQLVCSAFSPGGKYLAVGSSDARIYIYSFNDTVTKIADFEAHEDRIDSIEFNHSGEKFVSASRVGPPKIWYPRAASWSSLSLKTNQDSLKVLTLAWNFSDGCIIGSLQDHLICVWNSNTGDIVQILKGHNDSVFVVESHPSNPYAFISAGHDGKIILWDLRTGQPIKTLVNKIENEGMGAIFDAKFSPSGYEIAATDNNGHLCIYGIGPDEIYSAFPYEQFFHTDYRPFVIVDDVTLDEQTELKPHEMPPPYFVNIDGESHPFPFQEIGLRCIDTCDSDNLQKYGFLSNKCENRIVGSLSAGDYRRIRQNNLEYTYQFTEEDIETWKNRKIIKQLKNSAILVLEEEISSKYGHELEFYKNIRETCGQQMEEDRKNRLLSLKSKVLNRRNLTEIVDETVEEESTTQINNDPDFSEESSASSDTATSDYTTRSSSVVREICTRRNRYQYQESEDTQESSTVYPHLIQHPGITKEWWNVEKPSRISYFPQIGDIVIYDQVGHRFYIKYVKDNSLFHISENRLCYNKAKLRSIEVCRVMSINFIDGYPYLCSLTLTKLDSSGTYSTGLNFNVQFTDIANLDDFVILRQFYDSGNERRWEIGDLFKSYIDEKWWGGQIIDIKPFSAQHPENHFRSICIKWNSGEYDTLSPWDIFPLDFDDANLDYAPESNDWHPEEPYESIQRIVAGFETIQILPIFKEVELFIVKNESIAFSTSYSKILRKLSNNFYRRKKSIVWELRLISHNISSLKPDQDFLNSVENFNQALISFVKDISYNVMEIVNSFKEQEDSVENVSRPQKHNTPVGFKWIKEAAEFHNYLTGLKDAQPFLNPVNNEAFPDYLSFINTPMDFQKVYSNLMAGCYHTPDQFVDDLKLIINNSRLYNTSPRSTIYGMTLRLSNVINQKLEVYLPKWRKENMKRNSFLTRSQYSGFLKTLENSNPLNISDIPISSRLRRRRKSNSSGSTNSEQTKRTARIESIEDISIIKPRKNNKMQSSSSSSSPVKRTKKRKNCKSESGSSVPSSPVKRVTRSKTKQRFSSPIKRNYQSKKVGKGKKTLEETASSSSLDSFEKEIIQKQKYNLRSKSNSNPSEEIVKPRLRRRKSGI